MNGLADVDGFKINLHSKLRMTGLPTPDRIEITALNPSLSSTKNNDIDEAFADRCIQDSFRVCG